MSRNAALLAAADLPMPSRLLPMPLLLLAVMWLEAAVKIAVFLQKVGQVEDLADYARLTGLE